MGNWLAMVFYEEEMKIPDKLNENVLIIIAHDHKKLVGFNITIIDRKRYWRALILKHPAI